MNQTTHRHLLAGALVLCASILAAPSCTRTTNSPDDLPKDTAVEADAEDSRVRFVQSEVLSLLYLASSVSGTSSRINPRLVTLYREQGGDEDVAASLGRVFERAPRSLPTYAPSVSIPEGRPNARGLVEALEIMAMASSDLDDFSARSAAILTAPIHAELIDAMRALAPWHTEHVWTPSTSRLGDAQRELEALSAKTQLEAKLEQIRVFYDAELSSDTPFILGLVPIPGERDRRLAHAIGTHAVLEVIERDDLEPLFGVVAHELCHSLYVFQSPEVQRRIAADIKASGGDPRAARHAAIELNEALATAIGNGWTGASLYAADKNMSRPWYGDPVVDAYAKALYPEVVRRLELGQSWDEDFSGHLVATFSKAFPEFWRDPRLAFSHTLFIVDGVNMDDKGAWAEHLPRSRFTSFSAPAEHPFSLDAYRGALGRDAVVFVVGRSDLANLEGYALPSAHAKVASTALDEGTPFAYAFDHEGSLHVLLGIPGAPSAEPWVKALGALGALEPGQVITLR